MRERLRLTLTGIAHGGEALGRHAGKAVFVPFGAPGDEVLVEIVEEKRNWMRARLVDILRPSPDRIEAPCPYFGECGGCQLQHLSYPAQLAAKRDIVRDQLARLGRLTDAPVGEVIGVPQPWHYRNQASLYPTAEGSLGIKAGGQAEAVSIAACPLFHPLIAELFEALELDLEGLSRVTLRAGAHTGDQMIILETEDDEPPELEVDLPLSIVFGRSDGDVAVLVGDEHLWEALQGRRWRISALSPTPVNSAMAEGVFTFIGAWLALDEKVVLLDAGCGIGLASLTHLDRLDGLVGIEENPWAADDFLNNAGNAANVGVIEGPLVEALEDLEDPVDRVIVSPSRSGLGAEGVDKIARLGASRLIYVADDPIVLARDALGLGAAGYRLVEAQPFDMRPQTRHVQVVACWERAASWPRGQQT